MKRTRNGAFAQEESTRRTRPALSAPTEMQLALANLASLQRQYNLACGLDAGNSSLYDCAVARSSSVTDISFEAKQISDYLTNTRDNTAKATAKQDPTPHGS